MINSYTGTQVFQHLERQDKLLIISGASDANPVTVEYQLDETTWVTADTFTSDGARIVWFTDAVVRINAGTAKFAIA